MEQELACDLTLYDTDGIYNGLLALAFNTLKHISRNSRMDMLHSHKKEALRTYYKSLRSALPETEISLLTQKMMNQFIQAPFKASGYKYGLSYMAIPEAKEVDTRMFNDWLRKGITPGIEVAFPRTDFRTLRMKAIVPDNRTTFIRNKTGLTEPDSGLTLSAEQIDIVIMPLLIFDLKGNRVGYGKGFYDRFLAECRQDVLKIGLSFLPPVAQIEDVDKFDIPLDYCATPDRLYDFTQQ